MRRRLGRIEYNRSNVNEIREKAVVIYEPLHVTSLHVPDSTLSPKYIKVTNDDLTLVNDGSLTGGTAINKGDNRSSWTEFFF